jgi:beta-glucosidase
MDKSRPFVWGVATAAYQIEGAYKQDGKSLSIWDMFSNTRDKVHDFDNGNTACDSYNRWEEDIELIKNLGVDAYRFSLSWTRILPNGTGEINEAGLAYYDKLIDGLLENNITPYITVFHWDYPYALYCRGHWLNAASSDWFDNLVDVVTKRFGDRVKHWMTINEPQCFIGLGYFTGVHAPGLKLSKFDIIRMAHNTLLAHGKAVRTIRANVPSAVIGYAPASKVFVPSEAIEADILAAKEMMFGRGLRTGNISDSDFTFDNDFWNDPIFLGRYPAWVIEEMAAYLPDGWEDDMAIISSPVDFFGVNIYSGAYVKAHDGAIELVRHASGHPVTGLNWAVVPESLYWGPKLLFERYGIPILITENGLSLKDWISLDGKVHDSNRIDFLERYLIALKKASDDGVTVNGYFQWSLLDNFEWAEGYNERFGLVYVDFKTGERTPKDSYYWYRDTIKNR